MLATVRLLLTLLMCGVLSAVSLAQDPTPTFGPPALRLLPPIVEAPDSAPVADPPVDKPDEPDEAGDGDTAGDAVDTDSLELTEEEEPPVYVWYQPAYWFGPTPWDTAFELGVNGSSGTSDSFSIRTGGNLKRESDAAKLALSLYYNNTSAEGETTQSNALFDGRRDWLFDDSAWSLFGLTQIFYDEFQAFDLNVNVNGGLGYELFATDTRKLSTSFGAGASREFGGPDDEWVPEAQFGLNYEKRFLDAHKFYAKADYFPEWADFGSYRVLSDVGLEVELSRPSNVSLKLSVTDRFDSDSDGVAPNNTNFSALLLWKL